LLRAEGRRVNDGEDRHEENKHAGEAFIEQTMEIAGSAAGFTEMTVTADEASTSEPPALEIELGRGEKRSCLDARTSRRLSRRRRHA
jgi:hypothetical protein